MNIASVLYARYKNMNFIMRTLKFKQMQKEFTISQEKPQLKLYQ